MKKSPPTMVTLVLRDEVSCAPATSGNCAQYAPNSSAGRSHRPRTGSRRAFSLGFMSDAPTVSPGIGIRQNQISGDSSFYPFDGTRRFCDTRRVERLVAHRFEQRL